MSQGRLAASYSDALNTRLDRAIVQSLSSLGLPNDVGIEYLPVLRVHLSGLHYYKAGRVNNDGFAVWRKGTNPAL